MFKFKIGDKVKKAKGYTFNGVIVSAYEVGGGIRYDVQVDGKASIERIHELMREKKISIISAKTLIEIEEMLMNCHGMIHIFSEKQLQLAD